MTSIHNDDMKCFHVVVYEIDKLVVMGHINFKDHALIKRRQASKTMNETSEMFKDKKNKVIVNSNLCLLLEVIRVFKVLEFTTT
jgi:hypothetical protein